MLYLSRVRSVELSGIQVVAFQVLVGYAASVAKWISPLNDRLNIYHKHNNKHKKRESS